MISFLLLADIGDYTIWIVLGLFIVAALSQSVYRSIACPDREISVAELPTPVEHLVSKLVPNWEISRIRVSYRSKDVPRKFHIHGERDGLPGEIEIETKSKTVQIREVEIKYDLEPGSRNWVRRSSLGEADLPAKVLQKLTARLEQFGTPISGIKRAGQGRLGDEEGYKVEGSAGKWKFEAKMLSSGNIREIELELG